MYVPQGSRVADIGTDHGYIPIWLVEQGIAASALAMDVRKGPLLRAQEHIAQHGLEDRICTRISDGLTALEPGEADTVVIAGMGGELILKILKNGGHVRKSVERWIFSPQSELALFRHGLEELGLSICRETMLCEDGKYYTVMMAEPGRMYYERECSYRYGDILIRQNDPVLREYLEKERRLLEQIRRQLSLRDTQGTRKRLAEVKQELRQVQEAYHAMQ